MSNKTDIILGQVNLIGLISLASMHELQLPTHRMGVVGAFSDNFSFEVTSQYKEVLMRGLTRTITELKSSGKQKVADEYADRLASETSD